MFTELVETFHQRYKQAQAPLDEIEDAMSQNQESGTIAPMGSL